MEQFTPIIVAAIAGVCSILSGLISALVANSLIKYRLQKLEEKVDIHNGYAKKFTETSVAMTGLQKDVEWIKDTMKSRMTV